MQKQKDKSPNNVNASTDTNTLLKYEYKRLSQLYFFITQKRAKKSFRTTEREKEDFREKSSRSCNFTCRFRDTRNEVKLF